MGYYEKTFEWLEFPEGRARFAGGTRGWDESGHETFAVEVNGTAYYGEIDQTFLADRHNFNVEIISFGFPSEIFAGSPPGSWKAFTVDELQTVQVLILQLIRRGLGFEDRPSPLDELPNSRFMGKVIFRDGWALQDGGNGPSPAQTVSTEMAP